MSLNDIFINNYLMIYELLGLLILLFISAHISQDIKKYTRITILFIIIVCIVHNAELIARDIKYTCELRFILTSIKYIMYPLILIFLLPIMSPFEKAKNIKWNLILISPLIIFAILIFTSQFTHLIHYYVLDEEGFSIYNGGPLKILPYFVFFGYFLLFIIQIIIYLKSSSTKIKLIMFYIIICALLGFILFFALSDNDNFVQIITSSLLLYFLLYYIQRATMDPLTGLLNRQAYYQDMVELKYNITFVLSIDMNNLKYLNDTFGHEKGDEALKTISKILFTYAGNHSYVYRTGGDEFIIFYTKTNEEQVIEYIKTMKEKLAETEFECAFGYAEKRQFDDIQDVITVADRFMYYDKAKMKAEKKNNK